MISSEAEEPRGSREEFLRLGKGSIMRLESVRELKSLLNESVVDPMSDARVVRSAGLRAQPINELSHSPPTIALGVARRGTADFALAVRVQKRGLEDSAELQTITQQARGEVDLRYVGQVTKRVATSWYQKTTRPLRIGASIGHHRITAGTLGAFVKNRRGGAILILSNNHVLANEGRARVGDAILQPGAFDGGTNPKSRVGRLLRSARVDRKGANLVDAAVASIDRGIKIQAANLTGIGKLAGLGDAVLDEQEEVFKIGRTTGKTKGRITAFELDNVMVEFDIGVLRFDNQLEIEGDGDGPFSLGGDSGSLIVDSKCRAVALLFAGSDQGGANGQGLTYANPIRTVLEALKVDLYTL